MIREDEELLLALSRVSKHSGAFALGVLEDSISRDDQIAFGHQLVNLAEAIRDRALRTAGLVIEGTSAMTTAPSTTSLCGDLPTPERMPP